MNIFKHIQILVLVLAPACLMGMDPAIDAKVPEVAFGSWIETDKYGKNVTIEWHKVTDFKTFFDLNEKLTATAAKVFADEAMDLKAFLLDDTLQIKESYIETFKSLSNGEREELDAKLAMARLDREARVTAMLQALRQQIEMAKASILKAPQDPGVCFIVTVKNEECDVLGFAIFRLLESKIVSLDLLGVIPTAQGRGLAKILVFSILKLNMETKSIILGTELWNTTAQAVYKKLGFMVCKQKGFYISFEYELK